MTRTIPGYQARRKQYKVYEAKASEASNSFPKQTAYTTAGGLVWGRCKPPIGVLGGEALSKSLLAYLRGYIGLKCNDYIVYITWRIKKSLMSYWNVTNACLNK